MALLCGDRSELSRFTGQPIKRHRTLANEFDGRDPEPIGWAGARHSFRAGRPLGRSERDT
jgi:hypothetical protein